MTKPSQARCRFRHLPFLRQARGRSVTSVTSGAVAGGGPITDPIAMGTTTDMTMTGLATTDARMATMAVRATMVAMADTAAGIAVGGTAGDIGREI